MVLTTIRIRETRSEYDTRVMYIWYHTLLIVKNIMVCELQIRVFSLGFLKRLMF
jgi:hypothetical protein